jgi:hypothetical protein
MMWREVKWLLIDLATMAVFGLAAGLLVVRGCQ